MKTTFGISYPFSKSQQTEIIIGIDVMIVKNNIEIRLESINQGTTYAFKLVIEEPFIFSDGVVYQIEDFSTKYLGLFLIPEMIYQRTHEEFVRRIMEFIDVQRTAKLKELNQAESIINGQQLHHVAYLEESNAH